MDELTDDLGVDVDTDNSATDTQEPVVTETDADVIARLTKENKDVKDGNSRLGREFKSYKEENEGRYEAMLDRITSMDTAPVVQTELTYEDEEHTRLAASADQGRDAREKKNESNRAKYIDDYAKATRALGKNEAAGVYESILGEMEGMNSYSDNGADDAMRHYQKAEASYYKKQLRQATTNTSNSALRSQSPTGAMGGSSTVTHKESTDEAVTVAGKDPAVQQYMAWRNRRKGNDPDFLKRALSNEKTLNSGRVKL